MAKCFCQDVTAGVSPLNVALYVTAGVSPLNVALLSGIIFPHAFSAGFHSRHPRSDLQGAGGTSRDQVLHGHLPVSFLRDPARHGIVAAHAQRRTTAVVRTRHGQ